MDVVLEARGIVKRFGGLVAIQGVDLTISRGEILGLIGPNGAGKTTFVNCMSGLDKPSAGTILYKGQDITRTPGHRIGQLGIARTFQIVKPLKQMTVRDNVAIGAMFGHGGRRRTTAAARAHADEIIERLGLGPRSENRASELTTADLKRLELAKAVAMDPELLFLDEVMAGLNQTEVELAMDLIRAINASGVTIFVIEHVMKAIVGLSHRVVVLHHGKKIADGDPREVIEREEVIEAYLGERFAKRERERRESRP
jgi:branched-chain amino acid transport system ATP-binding protein